ncbi:hypothetical protein ACIJEF_001582 [Enterococcus faecalis]
MAGYVMSISIDDKYKNNDKKISEIISDIISKGVYGTRLNIKDSK